MRGLGSLPAGSFAFFFFLGGGGGVIGRLWSDAVFDLLWSIVSSFDPIKCSVVVVIE